MFSQYESPTLLLPVHLDVYLASGWFRMGQTIFTSNFLHFKHQFYSAVWLRVALKSEIKDKAFVKLKKLNAGFRVVIRQAAINEEKESLFKTYKTAVPFEAAASLQELLFEEAEPDKNIYQTQEVCIYNGDELIACGFFDLGSNSAAGISSFYHPDYKKYSLGKYLIYLKMAYCQQEGFDYFYPGYFAPGYAAFDYKLGMAYEQLEYWDLHRRDWFPIDQFDVQESPWPIVEDKLQELSAALENEGMEHELLKYAFYNANLVPQLHGYQLFDYPLLAYCFEFDEEIINPIVIFDVRDRLYHLIRCVSIGKANAVYERPDYYAAQVLKIDQVIFSSANAEEMAQVLKMAVK